jgi:hypothetical protein
MLPDGPLLMMPGMVDPPSLIAPTTPFLVLLLLVLLVLLRLLEAMRISRHFGASTDTLPCPHFLTTPSTRLGSAGAVAVAVAAVVVVAVMVVAAGPSLAVVVVAAGPSLAVVVVAAGLSSCSTSSWWPSPCALFDALLAVPLAPLAVVPLVLLVHPPTAVLPH